MTVEVTLDISKVMLNVTPLGQWTQPTDRLDGAWPVINIVTNIRQTGNIHSCALVQDNNHPDGASKAYGSTLTILHLEISL